MRKRSYKTLRSVPKDPSQKKVHLLFPTRKALRKSLAPSYYPITDNIYYDGSSFRVRVMVDGKTKSWNTPDKNKALKFRDRQLKNA